MIDNLGRGDELVVSKLSNALLGPHELAIFLETCRIKVIRVISIHDKIDSANHMDKLKRKTKVLTPSAIAKLERNKIVINMYKSGHSLQDIYETSGFSSRSLVLRVLNNAGVNLDRGHTRGQIKKKMD